MTNNKQWVIIRGNEIVNTFKNRQEAISYFIKMLKQTLKDFETQDKTDEFDYKVELPAIKIIPIEKREAYLGL